MRGRLFGYARVSVASDAGANNLETQRLLLADCSGQHVAIGASRLLFIGYWTCPSERTKAR